MKYSSIAVVCLFWVMFGSNAGSAQILTSDQLAIKTLESEYREAVLGNNIEFFKQHIAPQYLGTEDDGVVLDGAALLRARKENAFRVAAYTIENQRIDVKGDTAVVSECLSVDFSKNGKKRGGNFQVTRVWQKMDASWMVRAFQMTRRTSPCSK